MRQGGEYFTDPQGPARRRYEALRAYFVEEMPAAEVADRFGYSTASVHQMATLLRGGKLQLFTQSRPGPRGPRIAGKVRDKALVRRARDHSVREMADAVTASGTQVSAQPVWQIMETEGLPPLAPRENTRRGTPYRLEAVKAAALDSWPAGTAIRCDHAGLLLLFPAMVTLRLPELIGACGYPSTSQLSSWQSLAALLLAKCGRISRIHHISAFTDDVGLGLALGLTALPKATHLTSYSYRVRRDSNLKLQRLLIGELRNHQLATGAAGFNLDFHAIRHHGADAVLEDHYVPARSQRTRSVLTFFAQDPASTAMVYANADLTKAEQPREIIAFADYWHQVTGTDPGLLVLDSQLTTYAVLNALSGRGITWLTLRERGPKVLADLAALPASAWQPAQIKRAGSYRRPHLHEDQVTLKGIHASVRQIAVKNIGRPEPTLLITGDHTTPAANLFARYAERMLIENELDAYIGGFHLNALSSGVPLNVDLDTTLTVLAGNLYRLFARGLNRYQTTTPDTITCALNLRNNHPVLIQAGFADLDLAIPWWGGQTLRFTFPPR